MGIEQISYMIPTSEKMIDCTTWPSLTTSANLHSKIFGVVTLHGRPIRFAHNMDSALYRARYQGQKSTPWTYWYSYGNIWKLSYHWCIIMRYSLDMIDAQWVRASLDVFPRSQWKQPMRRHRVLRSVLWVALKRAERLRRWMAIRKRGKRMKISEMGNDP